MIQGASNGSVSAAGGVARNAELKTIGDRKTPKCTFSVAYGYDKETKKGQYINCVAWNELAYIAADIERGDYVHVDGTKLAHEYNGRTYFEIVCDFVSVVKGSGKSGRSSKGGEKESTGGSVDDMFSSASDGDSGDSELPF